MGEQCGKRPDKCTEEQLTKVKKNVKNVKLKSNFVLECGVNGHGSSSSYNYSLIRGPLARKNVYCFGNGL